jgi:hypothetical protein
MREDRSHEAWWLASRKPMIKEERREETGGEKGGTESLGIGDGSFGAEDEPDVRTYR